MKKSEVNKVTEPKKLKKLQLSRETLQALTSSDIQKVAGGISICGGTSPKGCSADGDC
jgi:hypothetical protein